MATSHLVFLAVLLFMRPAVAFWTSFANLKSSSCSMQKPNGSYLMLLCAIESAKAELVCSTCYEGPLILYRDAKPQHQQAEIRMQPYLFFFLIVLDL